MALTVTNIIQNDRGIGFEFTGDGATTVVPPFSFSHDHPRAGTITATLFTNAAPVKGSRGRTGLLGVGTGTAVALASATYSNGVISITTSAAVANGTVCYGEVSLDNFAD